MSKKKCGHLGTIARRRKSGLIRCYRVVKKATTEVGISVGEEYNTCQHPTCPFAGKRVPRIEDDDRRR